MNKESLVVAGIALVFLVGMGFLVWNSDSYVQPAKVTNPSLLAHSDSNMTGTFGAKVTMVEFGDYQCPACGQVYPLLKQVVDKYKSNPNFNFVFRNFPLPQHQNALITAEAAEAAGAQGKYWEMNDVLYTHQSEWSESTDAFTILTKYATTMGLDVNKFKSDVTKDAYAARISADQNDGNQLGVNQTPTVYLNGQQLTNFTVQGIEDKIDSLLK